MTGSNAKLLSKDIATEFAGRGDEVHMYPLSFAEFMTIYSGDKYMGLSEYMLYGGIPLVVLREGANDKAVSLQNLFNEIYLRDITKRNRVRNIGELEDLLNILSSAIGSLTNPEKLKNTFRTVKKSRITSATIKKYLDYLEDRETDVTIYEVNNDGSFCSETFIYRNKVLQTFTMTLTWEKGEQAEISNGTANNIAEIKYTSKGYLIYSYEYIVAHAALKEYYRVKPLSDTLRILTDQYVSVFNYLNYNFLTQNWDESNVETILLPRLFEDLYQVHTGEQLKKDSGRISAEIYENVMIACLPVTIEELRKHCGYDMESNTYDSGTFFYRGTSPFGEVVDYLDNSDGTLTLYVDAVWPDRNTDCAFKNEIVIKPYGDGTCQYLSNKVQKIELDIPVYEEY